MNIQQFYLMHLETLYKNKKIRNGIFSYKEIYGFQGGNTKELFTRILKSLSEEAQLTISLIPNMTKTILEVGGGIGLVYGYLKFIGVDITSIEPGERGYNQSYYIGREICKVLHIASSTWHNYKVEDVQRLKKSFDIIISNNVMEHIPRLEEAIVAMKAVLNKGGLMVHSCPNYNIPYECHYKIWLVPGYPTLFHKKYTKEILWKDLNFITSTRLKKICQKYDLFIKFKTGTMYQAFERLEMNPEFRLRQTNLWNLYLFLKKSHILSILKYWPGELSTPMTFTITEKFIK